MMRQIIKSTLKVLGLHSSVQRWRALAPERNSIREWRRSGSPLPPPHALKRKLIREYRRHLGLRILIETGTNWGEMVEAMKHEFDRIISIELSAQLHAHAQTRFAESSHIQLILGDSGEVMPQIVSRLEAPALFWLDGHYSGGITARTDHDTPILRELDHIFSAPDHGHAILIDDARLFGTDPAYPSVEQIKQRVAARRPAAIFEVADDVIRIITKPQFRE